jgi:hypothetical protein
VDLGTADVKRAALVALLMAGACAPKPTTLVGSWSAVDLPAHDAPSFFSFQANGTVSMASMSIQTKGDVVGGFGVSDMGSWVLRDNTVFISVGGGTQMVGTVSFATGRLTLHLPDHHDVVYERK